MAADFRMVDWQGDPATLDDADLMERRSALAIHLAHELKAADPTEVRRLRKGPVDFWQFAKPGRWNAEQAFRVLAAWKVNEGEYVRRLNRRSLVDPT